jgi:predicted nucleic acid-binding protein
VKALIDTSVLVAAIVATEPFHAECDPLLDQPEMGFYTHGLTEAFSTLTGGRKPFKMRPSLASSLLEDDYVPFLTLVSLTPTETLRAMRDAEARGVRGGAIFDYLHLVAARKAKARTLYTLNVAHFRAFHRPGDPEITHPS